MSTVLTNGIIIPDNGSRNWGGDLANNWNIIDLNVGYMNDVKNKVTTLENSVTTLETSVTENTANIQNNASNISALQTSKQDVIEDLETIRTGASAGATAVQPSTLSDYATKSELSTKANDSDVVHKSGDTISGDLLGSGSNNLGTSSNKWKTINGINPGALSLPNPSPSVFISKSLPSSGGAITADVDSWFEIRTKATSPNALIQLFVAGGNATYAKNTGDTLIISVPIRAGISATIFYKDIGTPSVCRLVPCLGNV